MANANNRRGSTTDKFFQLFSFNTNQKNFDTKSIRIETFHEDHDAQDSINLLKFAVDSKNDDFLIAALGMMQRLIMKDATQQMPIQLGELGICNILDQLLGQKHNDTYVCEACLYTILYLISDPLTGKKRSSTVNESGKLDQATMLAETLLSVTMNATLNQSAKIDYSPNRKRFGNSSSLFRIIKTGMTNIDQIPLLFVVEDILKVMLGDIGLLIKMVSCGICEFLSTILKKHTFNEKLLAKTCDLLYSIILIDIDEADESQNIQEKLTDYNVCEELVVRLLGSYTQLKQEYSLISVLKLIGAMARRNDRNKQRLAICGVCELLPILLQQTTQIIDSPASTMNNLSVESLVTKYVYNEGFADAICWCIGNLTFPNTDNQTKLGQPVMVAEGKHKALASVTTTTNTMHSMLILLKTHNQHRIVIQEGLRGLRNLCHNHAENLTYFVQLNGIEFLLDLVVLYQHEDSVLQWIMYMLASITDHSEALQKLQKGQITLEITSILRRFAQSEDLVQWTSLVVAKIATYPNLAQEFYSNHCGQAYLSVVTHYLLNIDVMEEVLHAIGCLAHNNLPIRQLFIEQSMVDTILKVFQYYADDAAGNHNPNGIADGLIEQCCYALSSLFAISSEVLQFTLSLATPFEENPTNSLSKSPLQNILLDRKQLQLSQTKKRGASSAAATSPTPQTIDEQNTFEEWLACTHSFDYDYLLLLNSKLAKSYQFLFTHWIHVIQESNTLQASMKVWYKLISKHLADELILENSLSTLIGICLTSYYAFPTISLASNSPATKAELPSIDTLAAFFTHDRMMSVLRTHRLQPYPSSSSSTSSEENSAQLLLIWGQLGFVQLGYQILTQYHSQPFILRMALFFILQLTGNEKNIPYFRTNLNPSTVSVGNNTTNTEYCILLLKLLEKYSFPAAMVLLAANNSLSSNNREGNNSFEDQELQKLEQEQLRKEIVQLLLQILIQLCIDPMCRDYIGSFSLKEGGGGLSSGPVNHIVLTTLAHHLSDPEIVQSGIELIGGIAMSPLLDALATVTLLSQQSYAAASLPGNSTWIVDKLMKFAQFDATTTGVTLSAPSITVENVDPVDHAAINENTNTPAAPEIADSSTTTANNKNNILGSFSNWFKGKAAAGGLPTSTGATNQLGTTGAYPYAQFVRPISLLDHYAIQLDESAAIAGTSSSAATPLGSITNNTNITTAILYEAANNFMTTGMSDQEEQMILQKKSLMKHRKHPVEGLFDGGVISLFLAVLAMYEDHPVILILVMNALHNLFIHPSYRVKGIDLNNASNNNSASANPNTPNSTDSNSTGELIEESSANATKTGLAKLNSIIECISYILCSNLQKISSQGGRSDNDEKEEIVRVLILVSILAIGSICMPLQGVEFDAATSSNNPMTLAAVNNLTGVSNASNAAAALSMSKANTSLYQLHTASQINACQIFFGKQQDGSLLISLLQWFVDHVSNQKDFLGYEILLRSWYYLLYRCEENQQLFATITTKSLLPVKASQSTNNPADSAIGEASPIPIPSENQEYPLISAVEFVVQILRMNLEKPQIVYYACLTISAMALNSKENSAILAKCKTCETLVKIMARYFDNEAILIACCQAIHSLKFVNELLGRVGICEHVVQAMNNHQNSAVVAEWVCRAISSLAEDAYNKRILEENDVSRIVIAALSRHVANDSMFSLTGFVKDSSSAGVARWACTAMYYLAKGFQAQKFQAQLISLHACEAVAKALVKFNEVETVTYSCCRALVVLLSDNDAYKSKLGTLGVCACIVESLHLFPSSVQVVTWGCRAVAVLAESNESNISKLGVAGACETIPLVIQSHPRNENIAKAGCDVISFMSEQISNGFAARFGHAGACEAVVSVLMKHIHNASVITRASIALASLARVQGNARWFGPAGASEALSAVLIQHQQQVETSSAIVLAMGNLCIIDHNKERLGNVNACELVVATAKLHKENLEMAVTTSATIGKLCEAITRSNTAASSTGGHGANSSSSASSSSAANTSGVSTANVGIAVVKTTINRPGLPPLPPSTVTGKPSEDNANSRILTPISPPISRNSSANDLHQHNQATPTELTDTSPSSSALNLSAIPASSHHQQGRHNRAVFFDVQTTAVLIELLHYHHTNLVAAQTICNTIAILSNGKACAAERQQFGDLGGCEMVSKAISYHLQQPHAEEIIRWGCLAVKSLTYQNTTNQLKFCEGNIAALVMQMFSRLFTTTAFGNTATTAVVSTGAVMMTSLIMRGVTSQQHQHHSSSPMNQQQHMLLILEAVLGAISNLCINCPPIKISLGQQTPMITSGSVQELDIFARLLDIMEQYTRQVDIVFLATKALFHLCDGNAYNYTKLSFCNNVAETFYTIITRYPDDEQLIDYLFSIMIGMSCLNKVGQSKLGIVGMCKQVLTILTRYEKTSEYVVMLSCTLIAMLSQQSQTNIEKFHGLQVHKLLATVITRYAASTTLQQSSKTLPTHHTPSQPTTQPLAHHNTISNQHRLPAGGGGGGGGDHPSAAEDVSVGMGLTIDDEEILPGANDETVKDSTTTPTSPTSSTVGNTVATMINLSNIPANEASLVCIIGEFSVLKEACRAIYYLSVDHDGNRQRFANATNIIDHLTAILSSSYVPTMMNMTGNNNNNSNTADNNDMNMNMNQRDGASSPIPAGGAGNTAGNNTAGNNNSNSTSSNSNSGTSRGRRGSLSVQNNAGMNATLLTSHQIYYSPQVRFWVKQAMDVLIGTIGYSTPTITSPISQSNSNNSNAFSNTANMQSSTAESN